MSPKISNTRLQKRDSSFSSRKSAPITSSELYSVMSRLKLMRLGVARSIPNRTGRPISQKHNDRPVNAAPNAGHQDSTQIIFDGFNLVREAGSKFSGWNVSSIVIFLLNATTNSLRKE
uniref:(northern house mosquito) hypothetical protein n=1 Tax=Culex pipiens TaxID=7175 RepID=A0A8D8DPC4_CULPI